MINHNDNKPLQMLRPTRFCVTPAWLMQRTTAVCLVVN